MTAASVPTAPAVALGDIHSRLLGLEAMVESIGLGIRSAHDDGLKQPPDFCIALRQAARSIGECADEVDKLRNL